MIMYKYSIDKEFMRSKDGIVTLVGKKIPNIAHGYVFVDDQYEAIRTLETKYPSNEYIRYNVNLERTNIIEL